MVHPDTHFPDSDPFQFLFPSGVPATDALKKGLEDLQELLQHTHTTFEVSHVIVI